MEQDNVAEDIAYFLKYAKHNLRMGMYVTFGSAALCTIFLILDIFIWLPHPTTFGYVRSSVLAIAVLANLIAGIKILRKARTIETEVILESL